MIGDRDESKIGGPTEEMKKSTMERQLEALEEEIRDTQDCIMGRARGKVYESLKIKLANYQSERKTRYFNLHRDELRGKVTMSQDDSYVISFNNAIPDL